MAREQEVIRLLGVLLFLLSGAWSTSSASPAPVCAGSREPVVLGEALGFCGGDDGLSCCDAAADAGLRAELDGLRISDDACAAIVKAVLCAVRRERNDGEQTTWTKHRQADDVGRGGRRRGPSTGEQEEKDPEEADYLLLPRHESKEQVRVRPCSERVRQGRRLI
ncbi:unnamed protein product [Miscanthus lutarioriparius]|uniref:Uncharacterized protein n=1 Tax=Miscanthus lutarioriparius TaxID=422564 RepID=A0A811RC81_9POAL|nr:unnamed protein product [Miscanthus lutarioriparius]